MGRAGGGSRGGGGGSFSGGSRSSGGSFSRSGGSGSSFSRSGVGSSGSNFNRNNGGRPGGSFGGPGNIGGPHHRPPRPINVYPRYGTNKTIIINNGGNGTYTNPAGQNQTTNPTGINQTSNTAGTAAAQQTYTPKQVTPEQKLAREQRMAKEAADNKKSAVKWLLISAIMLAVGFVLAVLSQPKEFEKLNLKGTVDVGYTYDDGFTEGSGMTEAACYEFYSKTGIPLFFYTVSEYNQPVSTCDAYTTDLYADLFKDQNHVLLAYYDNVNWWSWEIGNQVEDIISDYEVEKLLDEMDYYWYDESLSNDAVLANGISSYQEKFFTVTSGSEVFTGLLMMVGFPMLIISVIKFFNNSSKAKKHEEEAKKLEREIILSKPLETFGNSEIDDLKNKYDNL